jgi:hypothetical protein
MKRKAIIVDLDGTLCNTTHRDHLFQEAKPDLNEIWHQMAYDGVNEWCLNIVKQFAAAGYKIIFLTGRGDEARNPTTQWLYRNVGMHIDYDLVMRLQNDHRPNQLIKHDLYMKWLAPTYDVEFCIDDQQSIVDMWRNLGLVALHCSDSI